MSGPALLEHFSALDDPRQPGKVLYPLPEVMLLVLCASLSGAEDFVEVQFWGQEKLPFLRSLLPFKRGIPSHDTLNDVINALDPELFSACFVAWVEGLREDEPDIVAIDGKTSRRARRGQTHPLHVVSAWATRQRLVLGQQAVGSKSNEIIAIPLLLERLHLTGALVSIDAMGCQTKIAQSILDRGADYLLALKDNQRSLADEVEMFFQTPQHAAADACETIDANHGRIETRRHWVSHDVDWFDHHAPLPRRTALPRPQGHRFGRGQRRTQRRHHNRATLLPLIPAHRGHNAGPRRPRALGHREPTALGPRCRLPRRSHAPQNQPWTKEYGHNQAYGHEPDPSSTRKKQPQSPPKSRRMEP